MVDYRLRDKSEPALRVGSLPRFPGLRGPPGAQASDCTY